MSRLMKKVLPRHTPMAGCPTKAMSFWLILMADSSLSILLRLRVSSARHQSQRHLRVKRLSNLRRWKHLRLRHLLELRRFPLLPAKLLLQVRRPLSLLLWRCRLPVGKPPPRR